MIKKILGSSLLKSSGIYTIANIINSAIPFMLLPLLTVYLTPEDYGIVSMFTVMLGFFGPFIGLGVNGAISRSFFDKDKKEFAEYVSTSLLLLFGSTLMLLFVFLLFATGISNITSFPKEYLWIVVLSCLGNNILQIVLTLWRVREKALHYGVFQVLFTLVNLSLSIILIINFDMGWIGRVGGQFIAFMLFSTIGILLIKNRENLSIKWSNKQSKDMLSFGIPLIPHTLGMFLITMVDRVFVTNMIGIAETGIYTVGYQIGMIIYILQDSFNKAWTPYLFKRLSMNSLSINKRIVKITYVYFILILILVFLLNLVAPLLVKIFVGEAFSESLKYVFWISLGFAFNGMYRMVSGVIFYDRNTKVLSIVTGITAIINIILNYFLIKINGAVGAAQATCIAFLISFILTWIIASRTYPMPWSLKKHRSSI